MLKRYKKGSQEEIPQLFYKVFEGSDPNKNLEFKEHYVAVGKGKPELTALVKEQGKLQFRNMKWTLPYSYLDKKSQKMITRELQNSTCERVFFQHKEIIYRQRCLIPIDGYFEYFHLNGETFPYFIQPKDSGIFYAGGIWDKNVNEQSGELTEFLSIITTLPNPLTARIHNNPIAPNGSRMLLLIRQDEALNYLDEKLDTAGIKRFFKPYDEGEMSAHTVLRFQKKENYPYFNTPRVREYFEYPELAG